MILKNADTGQVKTRWNACHAMGHLLKTPGFPLGPTSYTPLILQSLSSAVLNCKNFKVRIAAASALGEIQNLDQFGMDRQDQVEAFNKTIESLKKALGTIDNLVDSRFGEFKYQDQLRDQLTLTLNRLASLS